ncbi:DUF6379 domain-containing protein [Agromyces sp. Marseille-P2726]|uniref:C-glycoside deglycosidase beta subunit domain-containing protein n=1 Tax=Agromyces sp. Marseille-P2726 TaxID=2709132 RepID=UPI0015707793|nr:DUF6379 domain-containing protein [Agromyces sp. Marseille-P2726]
MTLAALRDDALSSSDDGFTLRLSLPWIRSLPLSSLHELEVRIDGDRIDGLRIMLGDRLIESELVSRERGWWFLQDRVAIRGTRVLEPGAHDVAVSFRLVIPYLQAGTDGPLTLPFHVAQSLVLDAPAATTSVSRDVA